MSPNETTSRVARTSCVGTCTPPMASGAKTSANAKSHSGSFTRSHCGSVAAAKTIRGSVRGFARLAIQLETSAVSFFDA